MGQNKGNNTPESDETGAVISWIIIFILMFAFPPVGLLLLILKMRSYAKPANTPARSADTQIAEEAARTSSGTPTKKSKKKKDRNSLERKSGRFASTVLLMISIALFIIGANTIAGAARDIWGSELNRWPEFWMGVFYFLGGFISFFSRNIVKRRFGRYKSYYAHTSGRGIVPISDIAQTAGTSVRAAKRDIQTMIDSGYFSPGAYIDNELDCLVLSSEAAESLRRSIRAEQEIPVITAEPIENRYMAAIAELRELKQSIADVTISGKTDRIEELTGKIFRIVEENPEKEQQIRRFMSYYLPTTFKLLRSYSTLEKQGVKGENIMSTKKNIGNILDTLSTGFEQQLDQLFKSDAIDIAADISVLENLMHQDGLTGAKPEFQVAESGTF